MRFRLRLHSILEADSACWKQETFVRGEAKARK
jgi:hypothetical protein